MDIPPPFTVEEFLGAANRRFDLPMNRPQRRSKPRASALAGCARMNGYMMHNVLPTNKHNDDNALTQEQGRMFEDISAKVVEELGLVVINRNPQIALPDTFFVTGHPDGQLAKVEDCYRVGATDIIPAHWALLPGKSGRLDDGKIWGFEHKHLGRWGYEACFKKGLQAAEPGYVAQVTQYAAGAAWDAVLVIVVAQDASSTRSDRTNNLKAKRPEMRWGSLPGWNPKVLLYGLDARPLKMALLPRLQQRAAWLGEITNPADINREFNPENLTHDTFEMVNGEIERTMGPEFPCSYCDWYTRCVADGPGRLTAPPMPFQMGGSVDDDD